MDTLNLRGVRMKYTCPNCGHQINPAGMLASTPSAARAAASRRNGKLGGWPKGRKRGKRKPAVTKVHQISPGNTTTP